MRVRHARGVESGKWKDTCAERSFLFAIEHYKEKRAYLSIKYTKYI